MLLQGRKLVKTTRFQQPKYVGDPINTIRIFNDKEVDEVTVLDISASKSGKAPDYELIEDLAGECFMPLSFGGGIQTIDQAEQLFRIGIEKIIINSAAMDKLDFVSKLSEIFGSQSISVSVDVKSNWLGKQKVWSHSKIHVPHTIPAECCKHIEQAGAGEILLTDVDREGTRSGYNLQLIKEVSGNVSIPIVANGGAGSLSHFLSALRAGASAVSAGSLFTFLGEEHSVLINYPTQQVLKESVFSNL
jgi:cyclase